MSNGFVYIAGSGPGNRDYMTLKASQVLSQCDCLIYDALIDDSLLMNTKISCEKIYVGKRLGQHSMKQDEINRIIIEKAKEYPMVLRLKGGDPFVFGRGGEECQALIDEGIDFELIPGVTSAISVPEMAGIPVTHREVSRSFTVVTGHVKEGHIDEHVSFKALAKTNGTLVFLMGLTHIDTISNELMKNGMDKNTDVAVISNGTTSYAYTLHTTLVNAYNDVTNNPHVVTPAIIVVGETASFNFKSQVKKPLSGVSISAVGTDEFTHKLTLMAQKHGATTHAYPIVHIVPFSRDILVEKLEHIDLYDEIVFTSRNTIKLFFETFYECGYDLRKLAHLKIAAIGKATDSYLQHYHFHADLIPNKYTSYDLAQALIKEDSDKRILIPRAYKGNEVLSTELTKAHVDFEEFALYDTEIHEVTTKCIDDYIIFASSQGLKGYFENGGSVSNKTKIICIGPYTAQMAERFNLDHVIMSDESSATGIIKTLIKENERV